MSEAHSEADDFAPSATQLLRWPAWAWVVMIVVAVGLVIASALVLPGRWILVPLVLLAVLTPWLAAVDVRWHIVPNRIVVPSIVVALVLALATGFADGEPLRVVGALLGSAGLFVIYLVLALIAPKAMGMGDVKLAAVLGAVLGSLVWPVWFVGLAAGFIVGAVMGVAGIVSGRVGLRGSIPYAPAMLAGTWLAIFIFSSGM